MVFCVNEWRFVHFLIEHKTLCYMKIAFGVCRFRHHHFTKSLDCDFCSRSNNLSPIFYLSSFWISVFIICYRQFNITGCFFWHSFFPLSLCALCVLLNNYNHQIFAVFTIGYSYCCHCYVLLVALPLLLLLLLLFLLSLFLLLLLVIRKMYVVS